ncbi:Crp/Fnr family transcriptional regulator [Mariniphaga sediminis]|jgi:CRP/FNR family transcriptional regulator|uniref:Crp/Fnr family transcriptional regulator n=1 Tax=Mariniphaga sediminis TaxID=1628158 RepID=A0A399D419_9BACT|nr:Crp/Fnr family transcriptional regulator [Mariniphaga sediminis]RIH66153.1 Crp/Fnr family transcriptional regulator [Mariniphaga sediminis]
MADDIHLKGVDFNCLHCEKQHNDCEKTLDCCCKNCFNDGSTNLLKSLDYKELDFLVDGKQQIIYKPGETIIKQNTSSTYVVCIRKGLAKVYVEGVKGKSLVVRLIGQHDFVTGGDLFNGNVQKFTISAVTEVHCCLISASKLSQLFSENNRFAVELLRHHTKQNNDLLNKLVVLTQKYMPGRVADTLLYLKNHVFCVNPFSVPLTRQDLADMSNMTKESLVRILQQFKSSGLIKTQGSTFEILDENGLQEISRNG